jgi:hypothetical protein
MKTLLIPVLVAMVTGCNPYDPSLPEDPFRCGDSEPRCPDGFECVERTSTYHVCERAGSAGPDGSNVDCDDDSGLEPNETVAAPFITPFASSNTVLDYSSLSICPDSDRDTYRFTIPAAGTDVRIEIEFDESVSVLGLQILSSSGAPMATGSASSNGRVTADIASIPTGTYHAQVSAPVGGENNYSISFSLFE